MLMGKGNKTNTARKKLSKLVKLLTSQKSGGKAHSFQGWDETSATRQK